MTKEELEKEAEDFLKRYLMVYDDEFEKAKENDDSIIYTINMLVNFATEATKELEAQIEKMKCWCNCKNYLSCLEEHCRKNISFEKGICYKCKKWELRR